MSLVLKINDRIRTRKVEFWNDFKLSLKYDCMGSSFAFSAVFNPNNIEHKEIFCLGHFHIAEVYYKDEKLLTGYIVGNGFTDQSTKGLATFGGYSLPGVLEDCQIAPRADAYELQMDGLTLKEIAQKLIQPFGLKMIIDPAVAGAMASVYDKATAEPGQNIKDFLTGLASQKNILISHDADGRLLFTRANTKKPPLLDFDRTSKNPIPFNMMKLGFEGQGMHSEIHVVREADADGGNAGQSKIINPFVPFVYRPKVITQSAGTDVDTDLVAKTALADELRNVKLIVQTDRWEYSPGQLIKPNNIITVLNPEVYCYTKTNWFIEQVDFMGNEREVTTTITAVPPEAYNGEAPKYIWKGINLH